MRDQVTSYINNCEVCKRAKYDRNPPNIPLMLTETPSRPFQILHADTFVFETQNFATLIDAFSKVGQTSP